MTEFTLTTIHYRPFENREDRQSVFSFDDPVSARRVIAGDLDVVEDLWSATLEWVADGKPRLWTFTKADRWCEVA